MKIVQTLRGNWMSEKRFELRLCPNGTYYVWENGELVIDHISFDKWHKEDANDLIDLLNELSEENEQLKQSNDRFADTVAKQVSLLIELRKENEQLKKARDKSDKFIVKKGLEIEFLEWCIK